MISIKLLCNFIEITHRHGCSPLNLLHIFRIPFFKNTSGWLLLVNVEMKYLFLTLQCITSQNPTKSPNTLKQFLGKLPTNCLSVFGLFLNLALKGLKTCNTFKICRNISGRYSLMGCNNS